MPPSLPLHASHSPYQRTVAYRSCIMFSRRTRPSACPSPSARAHTLLPHNLKIDLPNLHRQRTRCLVKNVSPHFASPRPQRKTTRIYHPASEYKTSNPRLHAQSLHCTITKLGNKPPPLSPVPVARTLFLQPARDLPHLCQRTPYRLGDPAPVLLIGLIKVRAHRV